MSPLGRMVLVVAAVGLAAAPARAEEEPIVRVGGLAPFSEAELAEALRLRLRGAHEVEVVSGARVITISVDGKTRSIRLGSERGQEAARVVALVAAAIVLDEGPAPTVGLELGAAAVGYVRPSGEARADLVAPTPAPARARRWLLGGLVAPGLGARTPLAAGVIVGHEGRANDEGMRTVVAVGLTSGRVGFAGAELATIHTLELPVRAGVWLGDRVALGAAAVAVPYTTSGGAGDRNVLLGAGLMVRAQGQVGPLALAVVAGVDGMARSVEYRWHGEVVMTSGRARPWLAIGVTWEAGP